MATLIPHTSYQKKSISRAYLIALFVTLSAALGFLAAFLFRDIIYNILARYDYYDAEEIKNPGNDYLFYLIVVAIIVTLLAAGAIVATVKIDSYIQSKD